MDSVQVSTFELEEQLVVQCQAGSEEAWSEFVTHFSGYVFSIAKDGFHLGMHDAEEVFQETFVRAYEHLGEIRDPRAIRAWMKQVVRRLCIDRLRSRSHELLTDDEVDSPETNERIEQLEASLELRTAVAALPAHCREVLERFFFADRGYRTIGRELALPPGTIASRISRCLSRLRDVLFETGSETVVGHTAQVYVASDETLVELLAALRPAPADWVNVACQRAASAQSS